MNETAQSGLVSVIMPCYKMGPFVGEALHSVGAQSYPHWELIAVDDCGPEDGTGDAVSKFAQVQASHRVELVRHQANLGVSAARNTALRAARGEFLAFLDPDDVWAPGHLESHVACFRAQPEIGVSTGPGMAFDQSLDRRNFIKMEFFCDWEREYFPYTLALRNGLVMCGSLVRRSAAGDELYFDETAQLHEDWDLWLRLAKAGVHFAFLTEPTCFYRRHAGAATSNCGKMRERTLTVVRKHAALMFEYQWIFNSQLIYRLREQEEQMRRLVAEPPDPVSRAIRKIRRWLRA